MLKQEYRDLLSRSDTEAPAIELSDAVETARRCRDRSALESARAIYDWLETGPAGVLAGGRERPVVGYVCGCVPEELILACGAVPVRLCSADAASARSGEKIIPTDMCPLVKSIGGMFRHPSFRRPDVIVVPSTCDGKTQLAQLLSPWAEVYLLDLPRENDYIKHGELWAERYDQFYHFLKTKFSRNPSRQDLRRICQLTNRRTQIFRDIFRLRAEQPEAISALDYFALASASFFVEPEPWIRQAERLLAEAIRHRKSRPSAAVEKRILLAGSPLIFPNFKILEVLEQSGCSVAADMLCSAYGRLFDPVVMDEDTEEGLVRALSLKYIAASLCPCFLSLTKYLDNLIDLVRTHRLDGVVYHTLRLCQVFDLQVAMIRQVLKARGIPFLAIKTDLGREDIGQLKTRVEAFVEMLK